jgi:hypothetical protein
VDNRQFDDLARSFARSTDRRTLIKTLFGSLAGAIGLLAGNRAQDAQAAPGMTLSPTSGKIKSSVLASITGFKPAEPITLHWFDGAVSKPIATGLTDGSGATSIPFKTPYAVRGYHIVRAQGNNGSVADAKFAIVPSFSLKPKKGLAGIATKAALSGYAKGATIDVYFYTSADRSGVATKLTSAVVSASGTGAAYFNIPDPASLGIHRVEGREHVSGRLASAKFVVACTSASECPGTDGDCAQRTCSNGYCGMANEPAGTPIATQTAGDCQKAVCNGNGAVTTTVDNTDLPSDINECTAGICVNGVPSHTPVPPGTICTGGICNGDGHCLLDGACQSPFDCPGEDTNCQTKTCIAGICGITFVPAGTALTNQVTGNCQTAICDGAGNVTSQIDNTDIPTDGNECTTATCQNGVPAYTNLPPGTACSGGGTCDGDGICSGWLCTPGANQFCYDGPAGTADVGVCKSGIQTCDATGQNYGPCVGQVLPSPELCDGLDNDCDGTIDDGFGVGGPCSVGVGACTRNGLLVCSGDGLGVVCDQTPGSPVAEICNGIDDDCDGVIDNGFDLQTDEANCGQCGHVCQAAEICMNGVCVPV